MGTTCSWPRMFSMLDEKLHKTDIFVPWGIRRNCGQKLGDQRTSEAGLCVQNMSMVRCRECRVSISRIREMWWLGRLSPASGHHLGYYTTCESPFWCLLSFVALCCPTINFYVINITLYRGFRWFELLNIADSNTQPVASVVELKPSVEFIQARRKDKNKLFPSEAGSSYISCMLLHRTLSLIFKVVPSSEHL